MWIIGTFLGVTFEAENMATGTVNIDGNLLSIKQCLDILGGFNIITWQDVMGPIKMPVPNMIYFTLLVKIFTWDFSFMTGPYEYVRWFLFIPLSAAGVFGFFILFFSAIFGLFKRS